jgi:hypothetical protein
MRLSIRYIFVIAALAMAAPPASAQLDILKRARQQAKEVREAVKDVGDTIDDVGATADEVVDLVTPDRPPEKAADEATRLARECEARGAAAAGCVSMCNTVAQSITPTTSEQDAQATLKLCRNAFAATAAPAAPPGAAAPAATASKAVAPAATAATGSAAKPATQKASYSAAEQAAILNPYREEIARLTQQCDTKPAAIQENCRSQCSSADYMLRDWTPSAWPTVRPLDEVGREAVYACRARGLHEYASDVAPGVAAAAEAPAPLPASAPSTFAASAEPYFKEIARLLGECRALPQGGARDSCLLTCSTADNGIRQLPKSQPVPASTGAEAVRQCTSALESSRTAAAKPAGNATSAAPPVAAAAPAAAAATAPAAGGPLSSAQVNAYLAEFERITQACRALTAPGMEPAHTCVQECPTHAENFRRHPSNESARFGLDWCQTYYEIGVRNVKQVEEGLAADATKAAQVETAKQSYGQMRQECDVMAASNPYKAPCSLVCTQAVSNPQATGAMCADNYEKARNAAR